MAGRWTVDVAAEVDDFDSSLLQDIEKAAELVLVAEDAGEIQVSIALVGDETIARLNFEYLGHDGPTDVISFKLEQHGLAPVGDVYIGTDQARRQAADAGVDVREELVRITIHGILHVLGWDHEGDGASEGSRMYDRQEALVERALRGQDGSGS